MTRLNTYWPANLYWVYSVVWIKHSKHSFVSFFLSFVLISFILVGGTGLEPVSHKAPNLQSGVLPIRLSSEDNLFIFIYGGPRENRTLIIRVQAVCSPIELPAHIIIQRSLVRPTGLEPVHLSVEVFETPVSAIPSTTAYRKLLVIFVELRERIELSFDDY